MQPFGGVLPRDVTETVRHRPEEIDHEMGRAEGITRRRGPCWWSSGSPAGVAEDA